MWQPADKAEFAAKAFEVVHQNNRAVRERLYSNVRNAISLFLVISAFFLTSSKSFSIQVLFASAFGILLLLVLSQVLLTRWHETLKGQHEILASMEQHMEFHTPGSYGVTGTSLYPESASADRLVSGEYYKHTMLVYRLSALAAALFSLATILLASHAP